MNQFFIFIIISLLHSCLYSSESSRHVLTLHSRYKGFTVQKILAAPDNSNKLFICHTQYGAINHWERDGGNYKTDPIYDYHTNLFSEIDLDEKIEHTFYSFAPVNNTIPVVDIARYNDYYLFAHNTHAYICTKQKGIIKNSLAETKKINYQALLQKIYAHNDEIIAITQNGKIFKDTIPNLIQDTSTQQNPLYELPENTTIYAIAHQKDQLFLGLLGKVLIYSLLDNTTQSITFQPNFPVYTIDFNNDYLLVSDVNPSQYIVYSQLRQRKMCLHKHYHCCQSYDYEQELLKEPITITVTNQNRWDQLENEHKKNRHRQSLSYHDDQKAIEKPHIPDSCNKKTIYLIRSTANQTSSDMFINDIEHTKDEYHINQGGIPSFLALTQDNRLILGKRIGRDGSLFDIDFEQLKNASELHYKSPEKIHSFEGALQLHKYNKKMAILALTGYCYKGCQGSCDCQEEHNSKIIGDALVLGNSRPITILHLTKIMLNRFLFRIKQKTYSFLMAGYPLIIGYGISHVLLKYFNTGIMSTWTIIALSFAINNYRLDAW